MRLNKARLELSLARACMSARDLRKAKISPATIKRAINGNELSTKTAGRIARALGVDVTEIMEEAKQA